MTIYTPNHQQRPARLRVESELISRFLALAIVCNDAIELYRVLFSLLELEFHCERAVLYHYQQEKLFPVSYYLQCEGMVVISSEQSSQLDIFNDHNLTKDIKDIVMNISINDSQNLVAYSARMLHKCVNNSIPSDLRPSFSELAVPLVVQSQLVGVLFLRTQYKLQCRDIRPISKICSIVALIWSLLRYRTKANKEEDEQKQFGHQQRQFLSLVTHELRSPLNSLYGYLDLALMGVGGELNAQQYEFVQRARIASQRLYSLLEDVLCIARADSGSLHLQQTVFHVADVVNTIVEELALIASDQGVALHIDITSQLPQCYADSIRFHHIIRNILQNAIHFTPRGGEVTITVQAERSLTVTNIDEDIPWLCLQVRDTGIGIAPEYHRRIFERFYRVVGHESLQSSGQGLGLAVVKLLVELHGGTVAVESLPGKGSTFTCRLPCLLS
jgi:signal transduction histidine kinase